MLEGVANISYDCPLAPFTELFSFEASPGRKFLYKTNIQRCL